MTRDSGARAVGSHVTATLHVIKDGNLIVVVAVVQDDPLSASWVIVDICMRDASRDLVLLNHKIIKFEFTQ